MPRPGIRVLGVALLAIAVYGYGATSEVAWLFLLAYWLVALLVAAAAYAVWNRRSLRLRLGLSRRELRPDSPLQWLPDAVLRGGPARPLFEGDGAAVRVRLLSHRGTRGPARVSGRVAGLDIDLGAGAIGAAGVREERPLEQLPRGPVRNEGFRLECSDPLGFFTRVWIYQATELGLVLPRFTSLAGARRPREVEAALLAPRAGSGTEIFGVREYAHGDSLRRIHWRTSARRGELVVREFEPPGVRTMTVLLDPSPPSREHADQVTRIAASEAWDCLRDGGRVVLWAPGLEPTRPAEARSLWALLEWLARYPDLPAGMVAPAPAGEAVAVAAGRGPELGEALAELRRRGSETRAWVVGDAAFDEEPALAVRRAGLEWPFAG